MKIVKWLLGIIVLLALVVFGGGLLLKDEVHVERSVRIDRPPAQVYSLLLNMQRFNEWSPWRDYDPSAKTEFSGPPSGVGAKMGWKGDKGDGTMEIVGEVENAEVSVALDFGADGKATSKYLLSPAGEGTEVRWTFDSDFEGDLIGRWFGLMMDSMIGPQYERGLSDLKKLAESQPLPAPPEPAPTVTEDESSADPAADQEGEQPAAEDAAEQDD